MQILVNGLITGLTIVVLALAFTVVYLPTRVFHVAQEVCMPPFLYCLGMPARKWPWYLAMGVAVVTGVGLSLVCEWINHAPLEEKRAASGAHLISSLGIYIILVQAVAMIWGNDTKVLRTGLDAVTQIGNVVITQAQVVAVEVSVVAIALFHLWLQFSELGLQFRALADNPKEFALRGYNVRQLRLVAFGISGFSVESVRSLVAYDIGFDPQGGLTAVLLAVVAVIIGGRQSFWGPVLGGIMLGIVRSQVVWVLSARWQEAVTFLILALFLFVRPNGLLGRKGRLEAEG